MVFGSCCGCIGCCCENRDWLGVRGRVGHPPDWVVGCRLGCPGVVAFAVDVACLDMGEKSVHPVLDVFFDGE